MGDDIKRGLYLLHVDGGKRPNERGEAEGAIALILREPDGATTLEQTSEMIGPVPDPHVAEYRALLRGLEIAEQRGIEYIAIFSDSRTLVNQVNGLWDKRDDLATLCEEACAKLERYKGWQASWVPREMNKGADDLIKAAFERGRAARPGS